MTHIIRKPLKIPDGVLCYLTLNSLRARGKLGEREISIHKNVRLRMERDEITVSLAPNSFGKQAKSMLGTTHRLIVNLILGVSAGIEKNLEIHGIGYGAIVKERDLILQLGFSHDVVLKIPSKIYVQCKSLTQISIFGVNREQVGEFAARVRSCKKPDPYKGKGIRYQGEVLYLKEGKKK